MKAIIGGLLEPVKVSPERQIWDEILETLVLAAHNDKMEECLTFLENQYKIEKR